MIIVTASLDPEATREYWSTWGSEIQIIRIQGAHGVVPAFAAGVRLSAREEPDIIACLHDDVAIRDPQWAEKVLAFFQAHSECLLLGFGGALGLGEDGIYQHPYTPMDLVRKDFISNMDQAEAHGRRVLEPTEVACLDGFSQIGRSNFMMWAFDQLDKAGVIHHAYDAALGMLAHEFADELSNHPVWMLPIACHHHGGMTAVGNAEYQKWATAKFGGDQKVWEDAHRKVYEMGRINRVLPIRIKLPLTSGR